MNTQTKHIKTRHHSGQQNSGAEATPARPGGELCGPRPAFDVPKFGNGLPLSVHS